MFSHATPNYNRLLETFANYIRPLHVSSVLYRPRQLTSDNQWLLQTNKRFCRPLQTTSDYQRILHAITDHNFIQITSDCDHYSATIDHHRLPQAEIGYSRLFHVISVIPDQSQVALEPPHTTLYLYRSVYSKPLPLLS